LRLYASDTEGQVDRAILAAADIAWFEGLSQQLACAKEQAPAFNSLVELFTTKEQSRLARQIVELGLKHDESHAGLVARRVALSTDTDNVDTVKRTVDLLPRLSAKEANQVGVALWKAAHYQEAIGVFHRVVSLHPNSATAWANLGVNYEKSGQRGKARDALTTALDLDPFNEYAKDSLERLRKAETNGPGTAEGSAAAHDGSWDSTKGTSQ
jgi:Flp pilus assembly protein TadD